jgi:hypothetical protein
VCRPLEVKAGQATGTPACAQAAADEIAHLTIKPPAAQRGAKATFAATVSGKTLTITKGGDVVVTWSAFDPISKVVEVYASQYEDRVAVAYTTRRLGKDVTDVVAFVLVKTTGTADHPTTNVGSGAGSAAPPVAPPEDPKLTKAVDAARKAHAGSGAKVVAAWQAVLAIDADHSEAQYQLAAAKAAAKQPADAIAALEKLAKSSRADAIEWLVEARFDPAFAAVRADAKYRAAVGLDRKSATPYERVMGFGGTWEQTPTCGEKPAVNLTVKRDRTVKVHITIACEGQRYENTFKGTWRTDGDNVVLVLPIKGQVATKKDEAPCTFKKMGDEDALHCMIGKDLDFEVLPTRR